MPDILHMWEKKHIFAVQGKFGVSTKFKREVENNFQT
jgi:hypothetical protein